MLETRKVKTEPNYPTDFRFESRTKQNILIILVSMKSKCVVLCTYGSFVYFTCNLEYMVSLHRTLNLSNLPKVS